MTFARFGLMMAAAFIVLEPISASAASFNCRLANRPDEIMICRNPELSALDETMSNLYFELRNRLSGRDRRGLEEDQRGWLEGRFGCGSDYQCILESYTRRVGELRNY